MRLKTAKKESRQQVYSRKVNSLSSTLSSLNHNLQAIDNRIDALNNKLQNLPTRISNIRQKKYRFFTHLETDQTSLLDAWATINPDLQAYTRERQATISMQIRELQRELLQKRRIRNYNIQNLQGIASRLSEIQVNVSHFNEYISDSTSAVNTGLQNLENDLKIAESTVALVSQSSFLWKEGEAPVLAVRAKDLNNDMNGIITLTNHRFIFEGEKEIVLKKRLFIVTEKKVVRELVLEKPIGMINHLTKGRVGLLKGSGIFIEFKPQSGLPDMKLDTKGYEADWLMKFYNFIISGQADEELSQTMVDSTPEKGIAQILACQICNAPYQEEIYRGQTSVKCKYCGAIIPLLYRN